MLQKVKPNSLHWSSAGPVGQPPPPRHHPGEAGNIQPKDKPMFINDTVSPDERCPDSAEPS